MFEYEIRNGVTKNDSALLLGYRLALIQYSRTEYGSWNQGLFRTRRGKSSGLKHPPAGTKPVTMNRPLPVNVSSECL